MTLALLLFWYFLLLLSLACLFAGISARFRSKFIIVIVISARLTLNYYFISFLLVVGLMQLCSFFNCFFGKTFVFN